MEAAAGQLNSPMEHGKAEAENRKSVAVLTCVTLHHIGFVSSWTLEGQKLFEEILACELNSVMCLI